MSPVWRCTKCGRKFAKTNQAHSCAVFPLAKHFRNKPLAQALFLHLKGRIKNTIGPVKIESLPCCIHFVSSYTFGAVWAMKNGIRMDFRLARSIKSKRFWKTVHMSPHRHLYYVEVRDKKEIDSELLGWLKESYHLHG